MEFLANNWFYFLIAGIMSYMMFRGGGCCGSGHANHGGHGDSHGGGCCGGGDMDYEHKDHRNMDQLGHKGNEEHSAGYIENSTNIDMDTAQDPVCGMYVSKQDAIVRQINGRIYYFCSQNCANEFERNHAVK